MKARTNLLIDKQVLQKAHELGINISQACENALTIYIQAMTKANAWFGRQTHNLETNGAKRPTPEVAGSNPAPGTFLPVKACFLAILDKEVRFGCYEYKLKVKPSNSRFKHFLNIIDLRVPYLKKPKSRMLGAEVEI